MSYDYHYTKKWRLDRERGIKRCVDSDPVKQHIERLLASGSSKRAIAAAAGVSPTTITALTRHEQGTITRTIAAKILAVRPARLHDRSGDDFVPRVGVVRRLQALQAIGHTCEAIAEAAGATVPIIHNLMLQVGPYVSAMNRDRIHVAYEQLWDQPGRSDKIRRLAAKKGWAPPMAWDDDSIDDPAAIPQVVHDATRNGGRPIEYLLEDVEDLLRFDPLTTADRIAARLGYADRSGVQNALARAGRQDLLALLARNADLAHPGQANRKDTAA
ncbi:hypothetical protein [Intrasporangium flavum]|uniref:hypothetical protein n=1 Tax=Intrasporangium flavum TaxID=1428657 RepID=UPI00096F4780|nr:hypothetical protein [Intrasporangium flavum]